MLSSLQMKRAATSLAFLIVVSTMQGCRVTAPAAKPGELPGAPGGSAPAGNHASGDYDPPPLSQDSDGDGIPDHADRCPDQAEDKDGFEDGDGCPDPDNDHDRILDAADRCPNAPETYNGVEDEDGCPDRGRVRLWRVTQQCEAPFAANDSTVTEAAQQCLDVIARALTEGPDDFQVGQLLPHADPDERHPAELARARAESALDYLRAHGVRPERMMSPGAGAPICTARSEVCGKLNRGVTAVLFD